MVKLSYWRRLKTGILVMSGAAEDDLRRVISPLDSCRHPQYLAWGERLLLLKSSYISYLKLSSVALDPVLFNLSSPNNGNSCEPFRQVEPGITRDSPTIK